ncbi:MAG TPA: CRTAC1 family protein [Gemmataceae bacterium]|nr:CRTAC1 family protein [Gemmataceae bacterium]
MMRGLFLIAGCLLAALVCLGCRRALTEQDDSSSYDDPLWFRDDTASVTVDFQHQAGPVGRYFMPQIMGSGAALLDFDNDGRFDLYFVHNGGPESSTRNQLYHQTQDGCFEDVSTGSGLDIAGYGMGVAVGDMDNDGWVDVYVSQYGGGRLFRNRGQGRFEEVTRSAGVEQPCWGTSCAFVDYDRDGWLDLIVVNYVDYDPSHKCGPASGKGDYCHPSTFPGSEARLFRNLGRDGKESWLGFRDVTVSAGLARRAPGLGVVCADFNGDGWLDIFAANDAAANLLWINRRDGAFVEEARMRGVAFDGLGNAQSNMGATVGDVDGDGRFDLFISHLTAETHTLWRQTAKGLFEDGTAAARLAMPHWRGTGFGTILTDFDNDGALDIAVANGRVARGPVVSGDGLSPYWGRYAERNQLFRNDGKGVFSDISRGNKAFCGAFAISRGLVWGDFDDDGGIDVVTTAVAGPARFYRNIAAGRGHWLIVRARDPVRKRDAYGAVVSFQAGGRSRIGLINPGQSYLSSGDPRAHFGLGSIDRVEEIRIDWPDGPVQDAAEIFPCGPVDRVVVVERGKGRKP